MQACTASRRLRRTGSVALVAVYAGAMLAGGVHNLVEEHEVCEHGQTVHADEVASHSGNQEEATAVRAVEAEHAHCDIDSRAEDAIELTCPEGTVERLVTTFQAVVIEDREGEQAVSTLSLAPKHGPPSRA